MRYKGWMASKLSCFLIHPAWVATDKILKKVCFVYRFAYCGGACKSFMLDENPWKDIFSASPITHSNPSLFFLKSVASSQPDAHWCVVFAFHLPEITCQSNNVTSVYFPLMKFFAVFFLLHPFLFAVAADFSWERPPRPQCLEQEIIKPSSTGYTLGWVTAVE